MKVTMRKKIENDVSFISVLAVLDFRLYQSAAGRDRIRMWISISSWHVTAYDSSLF
jgi:hypothetical protein